MLVFNAVDTIILSKLLDLTTVTVGFTLSIYTQPIDPVGKSNSQNYTKLLHFFFLSFFFFLRV